MAYKHKYVPFKLLFELLSDFTMTNYLRRSISSNLFSLLMHVRRKRSEQPEIEEIGVPEIRQTKTQLRDGPLVVEEFNWQRRECLFQNRISLPLICRPWMLQSSQRMRSMSKAGRESMLAQVLMMMVMKQPVLRRVLSLARDCSSSASLPTLKSSFDILKIDIEL